MKFQQLNTNMFMHNTLSSYFAKNASVPTPGHFDNTTHPKGQNSASDQASGSSNRTKVIFALTPPESLKVQTLNTEDFQGPRPDLAETPVASVRDFSQISDLETRKFAELLKSEEEREWDIERLRQSKQMISNAHNSKNESIAPYTTAKYLEATQLFYQGLGISDDEMQRSKAYIGASGLAYVIPQIPIFVTRLITPDTLGDMADSAKKAALGTRGVAHANIGGVLNPGCDVLADLLKHGTPVPGSWFVGTSRAQVVEEMKAAHDLVSSAYEHCTKEGKAVPQELIDYLNLAGQQHVGKNATDVAFHLTGAVSQLGEVLKSSVDKLAALLTMNVDPGVFKAASSALTSLLYLVVGPAEELAITEIIKEQNAKYSKVFNADGSIDVNVAKNLWKRNSEVKLSYMEMVSKRKIANELYKTQQAKGYVNFLQGIMENPASLDEVKLTEEIQNSNDKLQFLHNRQKILAGSLTKDRASQLEILHVMVNDVQAGKGDKALTDNLCVDFAELIQRESSRPDNQGNEVLNSINNYMQAQGLSSSEPTAKSSLESSELHPLRAFMYRFADRERQQAAIEHQIADKEKNLAILNLLKENFTETKYLIKLHQKENSGNSPYHQVLPEKIRKDIQTEINAQQERVAKHSKKAEMFIKDAKALIDRDFSKLDPKGLVTKMINSLFALYRESVKAKYDQPGMLSRGFIERAPLAAVLGSAFSGHLPNDISEHLAIGGGIQALMHNMANRGERTKQLTQELASPVPEDLRKAAQDILGFEELPDWVPDINLGVYAAGFGAKSQKTAPDVLNLPSSTSAPVELQNKAQNGIKNAFSFVGKSLVSIPKIIFTNAKQPLDLVESANQYSKNKDLQRKLDAYNKYAGSDWYTDPDKAYHDPCDTPQTENLESFLETIKRLKAAKPPES
jgi:hypothetical protein